MRNFRFGMCVKWTVEIPKTPVNGQFTAYPFKFDRVRHEISPYMPQTGIKSSPSKLSRSVRKLWPVPSRSGTGTQRRQAARPMRCLAQQPWRLNRTTAREGEAASGFDGVPPWGATGNAVDLVVCGGREGRAQARRGARALGAPVIARDFGFHGNKAANRLRNYHDHGPGRDDARTNQTKRARAARCGGGERLRQQHWGQNATTPRRLTPRCMSW